MATKVGLESPALNLAAVEHALHDSPNTFEFFAAVRLLELLRPNRTRVGGFGDPADEVAHFGVNHGLAFPASEIQALELEDAEPARVKVNFMGLTGPSGLLPYAYSQLISERRLQKDTALAAFFDLFHHRLLSLFYVAWEKHRFTRQYERSGTDAVTEHLIDLAGLGVPRSERFGSIGIQTFAAYSGLLAPEPRSAVGLEQMIGDFFGVPVTIVQFLGGWYPVSPTDQCEVGEEEISSQIGFGALVGDAVCDPQARVRVRLGPLTRKQFDSFLPNGSAHDELRSLVRLYSHDQFEFEVQLVLRAEDVPGFALDGAATSGERLGWSTWIRTAPKPVDADETVLLL
jgi:type VI secretion system protein ImpH